MRLCTLRRSRSDLSTILLTKDVANDAPGTESRCSLERRTRRVSKRQIRAGIRAWGSGRPEVGEVNSRIVIGPSLRGEDKPPHVRSELPPLHQLSDGPEIE